MSTDGSGLGRVVVELCVGDLAGIDTARSAGADRVEFCRDLSCGGLTPDPAEISEALSRCPSGGLQVLIRSHPGDFVYGDDEIEAMCAQIRAIRAEHDRWIAESSGEDAAAAAAPRLGFVVGALTPDLRIDARATARFVAAAGPHRLTFHRAFDQVVDQAAGLEDLVRLGYERVLTTGGHAAVADLPGLSALVEQAVDRLVILASGGLRSGNVAAALSATGAREVHMRAPADDGERTDPEEARRVVDAVRHRFRV